MSDYNHVNFNFQTWEKLRPIAPTFFKNCIKNVFSKMF